MTHHHATEKAIAHIRAVCLALPEAVEEPFGGHTAPSFRVRGKLFVMTSEDRTTMVCKAPPGAQQALIGSDASRFFVPAYVGHQGWVGVRLTVEQDWEEISELITDSYCLIAPKRLAAHVEHRAPKGGTVGGVSNSHGNEGNAAQA